MELNSSSGLDMKRVFASARLGDAEPSLTRLYSVSIGVSYRANARATSKRHSHRCRSPWFINGISPGAPGCTYNPCRKRAPACEVTGKAFWWVNVSAHDHTLALSPLKHQGLLEYHRLNQELGYTLPITWQGAWPGDAIQPRPRNL